MGVRNATVSTNTILNSAPANGVETVVASTGNIGLVQDNAQVLIFYYIPVSVGAGATTLNFRIRRGLTTAGAIVHLTAAFTVVPSTASIYGGHAFDTPGVVGSAQYSFTVQVSGGAAPASVNDIAMSVIVL